ncbi:MAG: hypothetical protein KME45_30870 [Stenomitos rutilans HA7619-LM2]|nr:hypothetical protein [Stenomitos rutilans HA7619-LM2]
MATATLISGKVKYAAGHPKQTQYGERINVVISRLDGGEDIKLWGNPGDAIAHLRKGEDVSLLHDGKGYKLVATAPTQPNGNGKAPPSAKPSTPETWSEDHRAMVFDELKRRAGVLTCCHEEMRKRFLHPQTGELMVSEETLQKYAVSLFLDLKELW